MGGNGPQSRKEPDGKIVGDKSATIPPATEEDGETRKELRQMLATNAMDRDVFSLGL